MQVKCFLFYAFLETCFRLTAEGVFTSNHVPGVGNVEITHLLNQVAFLAYRHAQPSQGHPQSYTRMFILLSFVFTWAYLLWL